MYCVKCGVKLKDGVNVCPLCHTKMQFEESSEVSTSYSKVMPKKTNPFIGLAAIFSVVSLIACISTLVVCLNLYGTLSWGGYVLMSIAFAYITLIFPLWFKRTTPILWTCIDIIALELLLLYICLKSSGHWFLSFAFPTVLLIGIIFIIIFTLRKHIRKKGFFIFGGTTILFGLFSMLIEMFECITFGTKMFTWCLYVVTLMVIVGVFLILCGIIRPLKDSVVKRFYI